MMLRMTEVIFKLRQLILTNHATPDMKRTIKHHFQTFDKIQLADNSVPNTAPEVYDRNKTSVTFRKRLNLKMQRLGSFAMVIWLGLCLCLEDKERELLWKPIEQDVGFFHRQPRWQKASLVTGLSRSVKSIWNRCDGNVSCVSSLKCWDKKKGRGVWRRCVSVLKMPIWGFLFVLSHHIHH